MTVIDHLLKVQEFDCRIRELEQLAKDIPLRKKHEENRLQGHRSALAAAEEALKQKQAVLKQRDLEIEARREQITKFRTQQFQIKTNEEFRAIENEVKAVQSGIAKIEDDELSVMEDVDRAKREIAELKKALEAESASVNRDCGAWDAKVAEALAELARQKALRDEAAKAVDPAWLSTYANIFARRDKALVPVEDGVCGGCHMNLARYLIHDARRRDRMVRCDFCGRLLY